MAGKPCRTDMMIRAGPQPARRTQQEARTNRAPVVQVGDGHDGGINAAAHEAVLDGVARVFVEARRDARKGPPETRQERRQEIAGHGIADGPIDGAVDLGPPAMRPGHRVRNAGFDGAGALQEPFRRIWI